MTYKIKGFEENYSINLESESFPMHLENCSYLNFLESLMNQTDVIEADENVDTTHASYLKLIDDINADVDRVRFNKQLDEYSTAKARLSRYVLAEGCEHITETIVVSLEPILETSIDEDGYEIQFQSRSEDGELMYNEITRDVTIQRAEAPLDATVINIDIDGNETEIENPLITKDNEERAAAQAIVDATPQEVIDVYNSGE